MTLGVTAIAIGTLAFILWMSQGVRLRIILAALAGGMITLAHTIGAVVFGVFATVGSALLHAIP